MMGILGICYPLSSVSRPLRSSLWGGFVAMERNTIVGSVPEIEKRQLHFEVLQSLVLSGR